LDADHLGSLCRESKCHIDEVSSNAPQEKAPMSVAIRVNHTVWLLSKRFPHMIIDTVS
jgi:hypothetical protein